jgi:hypothetical protein
MAMDVASSEAAKAAEAAPYFNTWRPFWRLGSIS